MTRIIRHTVLCALVLLSHPAVVAAAGDDLSFFEEEAQVITASRRAQSPHDAPVAVEVITAEDIAASGAAHIWDLLRFRAGLDVLEARTGDGNRAVVSVRGFPREYVNNLLVLVDGRTVYSSYSGGVYWSQIPVQMQDIERIEIVRGPNAALYGSNAELGVIHIITRAPAERLTLWTQGAGASHETWRGAAALDLPRGRLRQRVSYSVQEEDFMRSARSAPGADATSSHKLNYRGLWNADETSIEFLAGGSREINKMPRGAAGGFTDGFATLRVSRKLTPDSVLEAAASRTEYVSRITPTFGNIRYYHDELEFVHRLGGPSDRHQFSWGANQRHAVAESAQLFRRHPRQADQLWRGFGQHAYQAFETLQLIGAVSVENSRTAGTQPAYQAAAVLSPSHDHTVRLSYARAASLPNLYEKAVDQQPSAFARLEGNPDLGPESMRSYELAYLGRGMDGALRVEANLYYLEISDLSASYFKDAASSPRVLSFNNRNGAVGRGAEGKITYVVSPGASLHANYTHEYIADRIGDVVMSQATPRHKFNVGGRTPLGRGFFLSLQAGYKDSYVTSPANRSTVQAFPAYWRADAKLAYRPTEDVELFVCGQNLLRPTHREFIDFDDLEVPRTFSGGASWRFRP